VQDKGAVEGEEAHGHAAVPDAAEAGGGATEAEPGSDDRGVRARDHHVLRHCRLYADLIAQFSVTGTLVSSGRSGSISQVIRVFFQLFRKLSMFECIC